MHPQIQKLRERKLVQWALGYAAAAWVVLQVAGEVAEPWGWPPTTLRALQVILGAGFAAAIVLAWYHGERGRQRVGTVEGLFLIGILAIAAYAVAFVTRVEPGEPLSGLAAPATSLFTLERDRPAIAVLPLTNISPNVEDAYFAQGMHEEIIGRLARISSLTVIARTSVMRFADGLTGVREIGRRLAAPYLLAGSASKVGNRVRVTTQLIDADTEANLWSETYDREFTVESLFDIQSDLANRIAAAMQIELTADEQTEIARRPTENLAAYQSYLLGRVAWRKRTPADFEEAIGHFEEAIRLDSLYALAYAGLADVYGLQPWYSVEYGTSEGLDRAQATAERALELDPTLGEAYTMLALISEFRYDWDRAEQEFRLALRASPEYATAHHWYANLLSRRGRFDEGMEHIRKAYELDPLSPIINQDVGYNFTLAGDQESAMAQYRYVLELEPEFPTTTLVYAYASLGVGDFEEGRRALARWATLTAQNPALVSMVADLTQRYRETGEISPLPPGLDVERIFPPYAIAPVYMTLGRTEQAIDMIERATAQGMFAVTMGLANPVFDPIRADPRFLAVARRVGLGLPVGN
jgi:TolB-like protein/Tfp pilus assembly protein PilF